MMKIGNAQLEAFRLGLDKKYCQELLAWFREHHSAESARWNDEELLQIITGTVNRARQHGIESAHAMLRYVGLAVLVAPEFDHQPDVVAFFEAPGTDPDLKVHLLSDMFISKLRHM